MRRYSILMLAREGGGDERFRARFEYGSQEIQHPGSLRKLNLTSHQGPQQILCRNAGNVLKASFELLLGLSLNIAHRKSRYS